MNKYIFGILWLFIGNGIFGLDPVLLVPEKVMDLPHGAAPQAFLIVGTGDQDTYTLPCAPRFLNDGNFHILDPGRKADKIYDSQFHFLRNQAFDFSMNKKWPYLTLFNTQKIEVSDKNIVLFGANGAVFLSPDFQFLGLRSFDTSSSGPSLAVIKGITFYWMSNGSIIAKLPPTIEEVKGGKDAHIYNESEIRKEMENPGSPFYGMKLDENEVLYVDGKPFIYNPYAFRRYFVGKDPNFSTSPKHKYTAFVGTYFLKTDENGNMYWGSPGYLVISDPDGYSKFVMKIKPTKNFEYFQVPTIAPNGDLYVIGDSNDGSALYRVKKQW